MSRVVAMASTMILVMAACLPAERTTVRMPGGQEVVLECELAYVEGDVGEGCTFVPGQWPFKLGDKIEMKGEVVPLGCNLSVPVRGEATTERLRCVSLWHKGRWVYGWLGDEVADTIVFRP